MSRTVAFVSLASAEYADAVLWYEAAQPGLGAAFRAVFHAKRDPRRLADRR